MSEGKRRVVMKSKDVHKINAFRQYANATEGMRYRRDYHAPWWMAVTNENYDPQVERALIRNFNQEWKAFS